MTALFTRSLALLAAPILLTTCLAQAGDRVGNGGGVWVCQGPNQEVYDVMFMDVFEARREYQLTLPETQDSELDVVRQQKQWIEKFLSDSKTIVKDIEYVENNITWIEDIINAIPDAANKITPHPSTCKQGDWTPVQLVNFTDDFRILVRRELFQSSYMSNLEKAAVYLHEGIYSYLRIEFGDSNSVRARAIVGYLLSNLGDQEKLQKIDGVLKQAAPAPDEPVAQGWICGIKPESYSALYTFEAMTSAKATEGAMAACIQGENPMPNFPMPNLPPGGPGMPSIPGPQMNCKQEKVLCEAITTSAKKHSCTLPNFFGDKTFTGIGRTSLEAQQETIKQCMAMESSASTCYSTRNLVCN